MDVAFKKTEKKLHVLNDFTGYICKYIKFLTIKETIYFTRMLISRQKDYFIW